MLLVIAVNKSKRKYYVLDTDDGVIESVDLFSNLSKYGVVVPYEITDLCKDKPVYISIGKECNNPFQINILANKNDIQSYLTKIVDTYCKERVQIVNCELGSNIIITRYRKYILITNGLDYVVGLEEYFHALDSSIVRKKLLNPNYNEYFDEINIVSCDRFVCRPSASYYRLSTYDETNHVDYSLAINTLVIESGNVKIKFTDSYRFYILKFIYMNNDINLLHKLLRRIALRPNSLTDALQIETTKEMAPEIRKYYDKHGRRFKISIKEI